MGRKNKQTYNSIEDFEEQHYTSHIIPSLKDVKFKNVAQKELFTTITKKMITISCGPAGCGKSFISAYTAIHLMKKNPDLYNQILVIKPAVTSQEEHGFLPGELDDKIEPYLSSTHTIIEEIIGKAAFNNLKNNDNIGYETFAFLRGKTLKNCIVVAEEMQNSTEGQIKLLMSRIGENCKLIISGDEHQTDLRLKRGSENGIRYSLNSLGSLKRIVGVHEFGVEHSVARNKHLPKILKAMDNYDEIKRNAISQNS